MCDYSLHGIKNRLANEGEQLFINRWDGKPHIYRYVYDRGANTEDNLRKRAASVWSDY